MLKAFLASVVTISWFNVIWWGSLLSSSLAFIVFFNQQGIQKIWRHKRTTYFEEQKSVYITESWCCVLSGSCVGFLQNGMSWEGFLLQVKFCTAVTDMCLNPHYGVTLTDKNDTCRRCGFTLSRPLTALSHSVETSLTDKAQTEDVQTYWSILTP